MQRRKLISIAAVPLLAVGLVGTLSSQANAVDEPKVVNAAVADAAGYIVVQQSDGVATQGGATFFDTGKISADTMVVFAGPDGQLPGGLTEAEFGALVSTGSSIDANTAASVGFELAGDGKSLIAPAATDVKRSAAPNAVAASHAYSANSSVNWSRAFNGGSIIGFDATATTQYTFNVSPFTSQRNAGSGLGYYRGYNGSQFGTWAKWYNLGSASKTAAGGAAVPWGNTAGIAQFRAKCATSTVCGGSFTP